MGAPVGLPYGAAWRAWWLADASGMLLVMPPILAWAPGDWRRLAAPASLALAALACALAVAGLTLRGAHPWPLLAGLPLLAAGLLLSPFVAAAHGLLVAVACVAAGGVRREAQHPGALW